MSIKSCLIWARTLFSRWVKAPEYVYIVIALVSVVGFVFITPPFQGPDEPSHYIRTQYIAHGYFVPIDVQSSSASLPSSIDRVLHGTFYRDDLRGNTTDKYELFRTKSALKQPFNTGETYKPTMISYSPLPYLPAIPGVVLANLLNLSPLVSMYIARLSLGVASILLLFFAIRLIPHKKYLFVVVGLVPMLLFQQAMITVDSVSYALLALFISYVLYLRENKIIRKEQWFILGVICLSIILAKPLVYLFLPLILLLLSKKNALKWIASITTICVVILLGWLAVSSIKTVATPAASLPDNVNSQQQLEMLLSHPKRALRIGWNSYMTTYGDDETRGVVGVFGAADTVYPLWMFTGYAILLGVLCVIDIDSRRSKQIKLAWKILAVILCVGYFVAVNIALYLAYTPVNFNIIYGVQGRYFLPILIISAAVVFTGGIRTTKADTLKVKRWSVFAMIILVFLALFITFQRYYLYTP